MQRQNLQKVTPHSSSFSKMLEDVRGLFKGLHNEK